MSLGSRRTIVLYALVLGLAMLAGCSGSDTEEAAEEAEAEEVAAETGVVFEAMEMSANEQAAATHMEATVEEYIESSIDQEDVEGEGYLDVTGIEPVFVGYEIIAWEPIEGTSDVEYVEIYYMNGQIVNAMVAPETPLASEPTLWTFDAMNTRGVPENPSAGETAALEAAQSELASWFPDLSATQYGVKRYLFLFEKDGKGVVLGQTLDGELASSSEPVEVAQ